MVVLMIMVMFVFMVMMMIMLFMIVVVFMLMFMCMNVTFVRMLVHVLIFFNTVNGNMCMCAFDAALDALFEFICDVRNA